MSNTFNPIHLGRTLLSPDELMDVPVHYEGTKYSPVRHNEIVDTMKEYLDKQGIIIQHEKYYTDKTLRKAIGILDIGSLDSELAFQLAWRNSVDGSMAFQVAAGSQVYVCRNSNIFGDYAVKRRHTGDNAQADVFNGLEFAINAYDEVYKDHLEKKDFMKNVNLSKEQAANILGQLYVIKQLITETQVSLIKKEIITPSFDYKAEGTLWEFYNSCTHALKKTPPIAFIQRHKDVASFIIETFKEVTPKVINIPFEESSNDSGIIIFNSDSNDAN